MGHKEKKSKDSKDKKHKRKHKKDRKKDRSHRSRHSSDSSSSEDERLPDVNTQLQMGRAAARSLREILAYNYELRGELRQLARHLDGGNALDISGIPDEFLLSKLRVAFDNLVQLRKTSAGHYLHRPGATPILSFIAPFLEETPASLASYAVASQPSAVNIKHLEQKGCVSEPVMPNGAAGVGSRAEATVTERPPIAVPPSQQPGPSIAGRDVEEMEGIVEDVSYSSDEEPPAAAAAVGGPLEQAENEAAPARRVLGPSMPPPELLAAAAAMDPGLQSHSESEEEYENEDEFVVGPPPPEFLETDDLASMDQRTAEVTRILNVLGEHEASAPALAAPGMDGAGPAPETPDAYTVLNVSPDMPSGEIKKRYWKLSLLIHPDKCDHPQAEKAFQAIATAAGELQDSGKRAGVDARRRDVEERKEAAEFYAHQERERQWRIARGEATPQDLAGPAPKAEVATRDTWMTHLPPERVASAAPPTGHRRTFSAKSGKPRQGAEQWTMNPRERALMLEGGGGAGGLMMVEGPGGTIADGGRAARTSAVVDAYNSSTRGKSLLETHTEKKKEGDGGGKKRKKARDDKEGKSEKKQAADAGGQDWDRSAHPWRPFDREKDLEIKPSGGSKNPQELLKNMKGLSSRFGGSSTGRSFL